MWHQKKSLPLLNCGCYYVVNDYNLLLYLFSIFISSMASTFIVLQRDLPAALEQKHSFDKVILFLIYLFWGKTQFCVLTFAVNTMRRRLWCTTQSSGPSWQLFWVSTVNYTALTGVPSRTKSESGYNSLLDSQTNSPAGWIWEVSSTV